VNVLMELGPAHPPSAGDTATVEIKRFVSFELEL